MFLIIIFFLLAGMFAINFLPQDGTDLSYFKLQVEAMNKNDETDLSSVNKLKFKNNINSYNDNKIDSAGEITYFKFNPNHLADSLWMKLGLSERQVRVIKNYESKGGHFYNKEDVKKMYCIKPSLYLKLEPYILIENDRQPINAESRIAKSDTSSAKYEKPYNTIIPIDLNIATEEQLDEVPGIGKFFAASIIKYKNLLGGYSDTKQLLEVYHYSDSLYQVTEKYFTVNKVYIHQKNVNTSNKNELRHPYINYDLISKIMVYRKTKGDIDSFDELKKALQITDSTLEKIKPYIKFTD